MDSDRFQKAEAVFLQACELPPGQRVAFVAASCGADAVLRRQVEELLAHDAQPHDVLESPVAGVVQEAGQRVLAEALPLPAQPEKIGGYRVLRLIGQGGFGVVYLAEQESPRRTVAVKLLRPFVASPDVLRRFTYEAQILGRLQHVGIAQIFEAGVVELDTPVFAGGRSRPPLDASSAGTTANGEGSAFRGPGRIRQPFFALEYVDGPNLLDYATGAGQRPPLDVRQRLELLARVCDALQHAHQNGVIHRDLKPDNILVADDGPVPARSDSANTTADPAGAPASRAFGRQRRRSIGQPKILDFGVARVLDADEHLTTVRTGVGQIIGTIAYMSPEQISGDPLQVDTRSDVYSAGVLLYQLLTGRLPYEFKSRSIHEAARVITEKDPTSVSTSDRALRGDVEAIVSKALQKDKSRRYPSASDFAADIRRYLAGEPIEAKRDSAFYLLRKNLRRYRGLVAATLLLVFALGVFSLVSSLQARENRILADREREARDEAVKALDRADATAAYLSRELRANNIERGRLLGMTGSLPAAEDLLWPAYLSEPDSLHAQWALWELYSRTPALAALLGQPGEITALGFSPDDRLLVSGATDGAVRIWEVDGARCRAVLQNPCEITDVLFAPDGARIIAASVDGRVSIWDARGAAKVREFVAHDSRISHMAISPVMEALATCDENGVLRLWNATDFGQIGEFAGDSEKVRRLCFSPADRVLAAALEDARVLLWRIEPKPDGTVVLSQQRELRGHSALAYALAFNQRGDVLATGGGDRSVRIWSVSTGVQTSQLSPANGTVRGLAFLRAGRTLLVGGWWTMDQWDVATGTRRASYTLRAGTRCLALSHDERLVASYVRPAGDPLRIWEIAPDGALTVRRASDRAQFGVAVSPDGEWSASGGRDQVVRVWRTPERKQVAQLTEHERVIRTLRFSRDGRLLLTGGGGSVHVFETGTWRHLGSASGFGPNGSPADFSRDGRRLVTGDADGTWRVWSLPALTEEAQFRFPEEAFWCEFDHADRLLAIGSRSPVVRLLDAQTYTLVAELTTAASETAWCAAFSADDRLVAVGTWSKSVEVWDTATRQRLATLSGHTQLVTCVAFDPASRGRVLASSSDDGTVKLWDVEQDLCLVTLEPDAGEIGSLAFSPDGRTLVAAAADGSVLFWDLHYYERHIAGNAEWQAQRLRDDVGWRGDRNRAQAWARRKREAVWK